MVLYKMSLLFLEKERKSERHGGTGWGGKEKENEQEEEHAKLSGTYHWSQYSLRSKFTLYLRSQLWPWMRSLFKQQQKQQQHQQKQQQEQQQQ